MTLFMTQGFSFYENWTRPLSSLMAFVANPNPRVRTGQSSDLPYTTEASQFTPVDVGQ